MNTQLDSNDLVALTSARGLVGRRLAIAKRRYERFKEKGDAGKVYYADLEVGALMRMYEAVDHALAKINRIYHESKIRGA